MMGTGVCMLARTGVSIAVGTAMGWHAVISSLRGVLGGQWPCYNLPSGQRISESACKQIVQSASKIFLEFSHSRCTSDTACLMMLGIKLIPFFQKRKSALESFHWCWRSLQPYYFQMVLQFKTHKTFIQLELSNKTCNLECFTFSRGELKVLTILIHKYPYIFLYVEITDIQH